MAVTREPVHENRHEVIFLVLGPDGYQEVPVSPHAPDLTPDRIREFVHRGSGDDTSDLMRAVHDWARGLVEGS